MKLGEAIYKAQAETAEQADEDGPKPVDEPDQDDVVDADFEDLDDTQKRA